MIRRLRVRGYKSLKDCTIELAPLTVLFGPNGAGKSNLLDLIELLSSLATAETVRDAFQSHRGRPLEAFHAPQGFGPQAWERMRVQERLTFRVDCDIELNAAIVEDLNRLLAQREEATGTKTTYTRVTERLVRYSLEISIHPRSGELFVSDEALVPLRRDLEPKADGSRKPFLELEQEPGGRSRFVARVERQSHPRYFEPARNRTLVAELSDPVYHPHVVAVARELASWRVYYVDPTAMRSEIGVQSATEPGKRGELLSALYYFLQEKQPAALAGIAANLRQIVPGMQGVSVAVREGMLELLAHNENGGSYSARLLSEGTLRLLCLLGLAVSPSPPSLVVYEEPENGVNPARLDIIAQIVRNAVEARCDGLQFLLTTHSPLVCSLLPEHLVRCSWSAREGTVFDAFPFEPRDLYFRDEVLQALDSDDLGTRVADRPDDGR